MKKTIVIFGLIPGAISSLDDGGHGAVRGQGRL